MGIDSIKVPVEYTIITTSDWTMFEIVEGGWWENLQVEYFEGKDKLTHLVKPNDKSIRIDKNSEDETLVVISVKGILNILREFRHLQLKFKISKGDVKSTKVILTAPKRESICFENKGKVDDDPRNPRLFTCPAQYYLPDLRKDKVFIVHGRDQDLIQTYRLKEFLRSKKVEPIVLEDLSNFGKTIIEQIEYARNNVSYAFVILTPDDVGCLKEDIENITIGQKTSKSKEIKVMEKLEDRARQNVLFEYGFFLGALRRENVCYIKQKDVEVPSDLEGILYKSFNKYVNEAFPEIQKELFPES